MKIPLSHQVVDQLSPYHDSQFSAFSTEVLIRFRPGHNRSSSPCTTHDSELMHIRPNSRRRTLPKVFGLYEGGRDNALSNKPLVSRYAQNSDVATCQNASLLLGYTKKPGDVYQQETVKKVYAGS